MGTFWCSVHSSCHFMPCQFSVIWVFHHFVNTEVTNVWRVSQGNSTEWSRTQMSGGTELLICWWSRLWCCLEHKQLEHGYRLTEIYFKVKTGMENNADAMQGPLDAIRFNQRLKLKTQQAPGCHGISLPFSFIYRVFFWQSTSGIDVLQACFGTSEVL